MRSFSLNSLRKNSRICHSEPRSVFERGEESAFSLVSLRTADPSLASCPPGMWLLVHLAEVSVVANIVVAPAAVLFAASLPLGRQTINRTSLRTNGTRSVDFEDDQSHD